MARWVVCQFGPEPHELIDECQNVTYVPVPKDRVDESGREGGYLIMKQPGIVALNGDPVGTFTIDDEDRICIKWTHGAAGVEETLQLADEKELILSLHLGEEDSVTR